MKLVITFLFVVLIGLFFRTYNAESLFRYGHEQDLQAWIVKDIIKDGHLRLIGQETSITGVFIGPIYYYLVAAAFLMMELNPFASVIPITIIAMLTLVSVFYIFTKLYGKSFGIIGSFIYAVSLPIVFFDRWAVPTQPTLFWSIWYLYTIIKLGRGQYEVLPILAILIGLIWHIHIAFIPLLLIIPIAIFVSHKPVVLLLREFKKKRFYISLIGLLILILPFVVFEYRHGFQQIRGIIRATQEGNSVIHGLYKTQIIMKYISQELTDAVFKDTDLAIKYIWIVPLKLILFLGVLFYLKRKNLLPKMDIALIVIWIFDVFVVQIASLRPIEDYYFSNLVVVGLLVTTALVRSLYMIDRVKPLILTLGLLLFLQNYFKLINFPKMDNELIDKAKAAEYIANDYREKNFKCVGVTYIGDIGVRYGYRYLFWRNGINLISPGSGIPVYNLVFPSSISQNEVDRTFGSIGIILPKNYYLDSLVCGDTSRKLAPLNGFVN